MRTILAIGIGTGNPEHMTVQAIGALNRADLVLLPRKGDEKAGLAALRRDICARFITSATTRVVEFDLPVRAAGNPSYRQGVDDWHAAIAGRYAQLLETESGDGATVALLVWGDPSLYDSTLRILAHLRATRAIEMSVEVIPGITSVQALAASHAMALNTIGGSVLMTTGRRLAASGFPGNAETIVVMLDGELAFRTLDGACFDIWWGAYLGSADEMVIAGRLADVADTIAEARARARARKGWIMDIYAIRRAKAERD